MRDSNAVNAAKESVKGEFSHGLHEVYHALWVGISQVVLIFDLVLQGQLIQLFGRRQRHSLNRRAREHFSETLREERCVRIVDPDAELTRLSNDPIVYESDNI